MQGDIASSVLLPLILGFIMFSLGLGLAPADFGRILTQPRALLVGMVCHFVLLPLVCYAMLQLQAGATMLLARLSQHSVQQMGLCAGQSAWAQVKGVALLD